MDEKTMKSIDDLANMLTKFGDDLTKRFSKVVDDFNKIFEKDYKKEKEVEEEEPEVEDRLAIDGVSVACTSLDAVKSVMRSLSVRRFKGHKEGPDNSVLIPNEEIAEIGVDKLGDLIVYFKEKGWVIKNGDKGEA